MLQNRSEEMGHHPFRSQRFYHANNVWFFMIRGGASKGPYTKRVDAESALKEYIETQGRLDQMFHNAEKIH